MRYILFLGFIIISVSISFTQEKSDKKFTKADSLRGMLTELRSSYNVTFYHLDLRIDPGDQTIKGSNTIYFKTVSDFDEMQIDLYKNLNIEKIILDNKLTISFRRVHDAVMVKIPFILQKGSDHSIEVYYYGEPTVASRPPWDGGFTWEKDTQGNPWVVVTCQGDGASLWWPNKDHQSDEPDSMLISITVPPGLQNISNGRLRNTEILDDGWIRFDWFVSYPINNYNVTFNIGNYAHFKDVYVDGDTLTLDYYVMPENLNRAKIHFGQVKGMMECYEHYFGPYPFKRDGYKLVECPHTGMEHQSAVAYGNHYLGGYRGRAPSEAGLKFDFIIIHETAHEWWGNSVTSNDIADMWIHESFGAYTEALYLEYFYGYDESLVYINGKKQGVRNDRPIIGPFNVNHPGSGDMYNKGQLVLNTLRNVINNDSLWFVIIKGLHEDFKYQCIDGTDIFSYINDKTNQDYGYFFEQYLMNSDLPELNVFITKKGKKTTARYKWTADVKEFRMPIKVTTAEETYNFIYPTTETQVLDLGEMDPTKFKIAEDLFYIDFKLGWTYLDPNFPER